MKTVLISGAGIGGPTLAYWLKAAGLEPTLVEVAPAPRSGGFVIDFWGVGYDIAERMGLTPEIERIGYHIREMRIVDGNGERIAGFGTRVFRELTGGRFVTLGRSDLSRLLIDKIKDATEIFYNDEIVALQDSMDGVQVRFRNRVEGRFDLVIGADGLHSGVRRLSFGAPEMFEKQLGYVAAAFEVRGYRPRDEGVYVMYGEPGRLIGRFALREDRTLFLFILAEKNFPFVEMPGLPEQKAMLRRHFESGEWECPSILAELDRTEDLYFDRISQIVMTPWSRGRICLLGDAASCVSLLAGQGAALAMTAGYVLAGELLQANGFHRRAFASYESLLHRYTVSKQRIAERFGAAFVPETKLGLILRNQVIKACALPGIARFTFGRDIFDTLQLRTYPWRSAES